MDNQNNKLYWGLNSGPTLGKFIDIIPKGIALDIGAGEGRNSFFLERNGFEVEAIDKDSTGLEKCKSFAQENNLSITTKVCDIKEFDFQENKYSLVVARNSIDFMKKSEIEIVIEKIKKSLTQNGLVYFSVFSLEEPAYLKVKKMGLEEIEENTFYLPKYKVHRHFFIKEELEKLFEDFKIIYSEEIQINDPGHGETKPHVHYTLDSHLNLNTYIIKTNKF